VFGNVVHGFLQDSEDYGLQGFRYFLFLYTPGELKKNIRYPLTGKHLLAYIICMDMDDVFKALADPTRRRLLDQLHSNNGQTLGDLCRNLNMTRQAVSQHLARLENANLVATVRQGREKLHYLNPVPIHEIYERWIEKYEEQHLRALRDLKKRAERR
jgi:DNA-binding transcriptional ArsR family regulator